MRERTNRRVRGGFGPLLVGCLAVLASGCDLEVRNPGAITDESLNDPDLMDVVAAGVSQEFSIIADGLSFEVLRLTDEAAGTGSYFQTGRQRRGAMDWDETGGEWEQFHETIWTGQSAWFRMTNLEDYDQTSSQDAARMWLLMGLSQRWYGESFCEVVYSVGPSPEESVLGGLRPREEAFDSAIAALNLSINIAQAAGTSYAADSIIPAARAGIAQAYAAKGDFGNATTWSTQVETDFVYNAIYNRSSNSNLIYFETHERAEVGLWDTYAQDLAEQDPRVPYAVCGTWVDPDNPKNSDVEETNAPGCQFHQGADGITAHYMQLKYDDWGSEIPVATGVEMRLFEAEAALLAGDMTDFKAAIDAVRDHYGLDPLSAEPATAGSLEYPIDYDASTGDVSATDAWSVLDGERHLTLWGEGRRLWDLHRWDHPFLDGGIVFWDAEPRRVSCYPVPEVECQLNELLDGQSLMTGVGSGTQTCG